ncbi:hypothetical protein CBW42_07335 [Butyricicoccus porcorum]|uniref:Uncharacterized protein n=1 Tax=Butyricicoccus porcorum TaxID=1945634 RepID=A0A252F4I1_9FIRM|nr:hypothetical protein CBW42_07335 [Butyricicoccus porcorum]
MRKSDFEYKFVAKESAFFPAIFRCGVSFFHFLAILFRNSSGQPVSFGFMLFLSSFYMFICAFLS